MGFRAFRTSVTGPGEYPGDKAAPFAAKSEVHRTFEHCKEIREGVGKEGDKVRVRLEFEAYLGAPESYDEVEIAGSPALKSRVEGGIPGDLATASIVVNAIPRVLAALPGLITMRDLPPAHWWPGNAPAGR